MRSKTTTLYMIMLTALTIMFTFLVSGLPGWLNYGIREAYAAGGMDNCGPNLSTAYGESNGILSIQVIDKSNPSRSMYSTYSSEADYPWHSKRSSIKEVSIYSGVESIGPSAFKDMTSLKEVYLPKSMKYIYSDAFKGCTKLEKVYYGGSDSDWQTLMTNTYFGNEPLDEATTIYGDDGEKTYDFNSPGGGIKEFNGLNNLRLRNSFAILENNNLLLTS